MQELSRLIVGLLEEITIADYVGSNPPQSSYGGVIENRELWAFSWSSALLKKEIYLKFAMKNDCFYYVSLHKSRKKVVVRS